MLLWEVVARSEGEPWVRKGREGGDGVSEMVLDGSKSLDFRDGIVGMKGWDSEGGTVALWQITKG